MRRKKRGERGRAAQSSGPGQRSVGRSDEVGGPPLSRRLLLSMKADTAPCLMRGEVGPPVGPPQAHSLGDEKAFPAAEQVPALARTCLI